jgi:hypothetical protein
MHGKQKHVHVCVKMKEPMHDEQAAWQGVAHHRRIEAAVARRLKVK